MTQGTTQGDPLPMPARKIGLWGASGSGKTSFLAALSVAALRSRQPWMILGKDPAATEFLIQSTEALTSQRQFPRPTEGIQTMGWTLNSQVSREIQGRWGRKEIVEVPLSIELDVIDPAGGLLRNSAQQQSAVLDDLGYNDQTDPGRGGTSAEVLDLVDHLAECDGILYLFDPTREFERGDEFAHFHGILQKVQQAVAERGHLAGALLPHRLAVCVTKFDDYRVFDTARRRGHLEFDSRDEYRFPRVKPDRVEELYADLVKVSPTGNGQMVQQGIRAYFDKSRVRYFETSSIGFFVNPSLNRFRASDFQNVVPNGVGGPTIRGAIHPINILEPLLWLSGNDES